jgi:hypothetical protein
MPGSVPGTVRDRARPRRAPSYYSRNGAAGARAVLGPGPRGAEGGPAGLGHRAGRADFARGEGGAAGRGDAACRGWRTFTRARPVNLAPSALLSLSPHLAAGTFG